MRTSLLWLLALPLFLIISQPAHSDHCLQEQFENDNYIVCAVDPLTEDLRLFWQNDDGQAFRHFSTLSNALGERNQKLSFAMNAGMYLPDFRPSGLYVEDGQERRPLITRSIDAELSTVPNFYKKPNGVFLVGALGARVMTTEAFLADRPDVRFATQSGPMLVIDGDIHPVFIPNSADRTRRSGIGTCDDGRVRLAISDGRVNFYDFARLFRDKLKCSNALFLDGGRGTGIYEPNFGRRDFSWHGGFGPMFGLVEPLDSQR